MTEMRTRPYVWQMVKEAAGSLDREVGRADISEYIHAKYTDVKDSTIGCQITICCVNLPSRIDYSLNRKPRLATGRYDFLFRARRGRFEIYDSTKHGEWEIRVGEDGDPVVALVGGKQFPPGPRKTGGGPQGGRALWTMPTREAFLRGVEEYEKREQREAVYKIAQLVVSHFWDNPSRVADGVAALLVSWNRAFYRFGLFSVDKLVKCSEDNADLLAHFRSRDIWSLSVGDADAIEGLFGAFLEALRIESGKSEGRKSPVAVGKALHLLAPSFFPIWDQKIARAYGCYYSSAPAQKYVHFCGITKDMAEVAQEYTSRSDKTLVKLIDQYNYSKFTRGWV